MSDTVVVSFPEYTDERGKLVVVESGKSIPMEIKRVFFITDIPKGAHRGGHRHKSCEQVLFAIRGRFSLLLDGELLWMSNPHIGVYVPPGTAIEMRDFSEDAVVLVLASEHYDAGDYEPWP